MFGLPSLSAVVHIVGWHGVVVPEPLAKRLKSGRASCRKHEVRIVEGKQYVKQFVDLRRIRSTLVYVQIENALF